MINGLQITIQGEELRGLLAERIHIHEKKVAALDERLRDRAGDQSFDVRPEDDFKTVPQLAAERQHYAGRVSTLALLRDHLLPAELYTLGQSDLHLVELVAAEPHAEFEIAPDTTVACAAVPRSEVIHGLKLKLTGRSIRELLEQRTTGHLRSAEHWKRELARTPEEQTDEDPLLPDHMCENETERHEWRVDVLEFIREHIDAAATYYVGESDLEFGELMPPKPGSVAQQEYEERTSIGFNLERLTKQIGVTALGWSRPVVHETDS